MLLQKVQWGDGKISSCPEWLVNIIRKNDPKLRILAEMEVSSGKINVIEQEISEDWFPVKPNYKPVPFCDTKHVNALENKEEWLRIRKKGIGGSESATARGFGKYQSMRSLYWDKTNDPQFQPMDMSQNWEILEYGHLLEPWIRKVFQAKIMKPVKEVPVMFQHPLFPFMLADIDGVVIDTNMNHGFEAKTTNPHNLKEWKNNSIPPHYVAQMQHYMAVMNFSDYYIVCAYGNTRNDFFCRKIYRDFEVEREMILGEAKFWRFVDTKKEPPLELERNIPAVYQEYVHRNRVPRRIELPYDSNMIFIEHFADLEAEKKELALEKERVENELKKLKSLFLTQMKRDNGYIASGATIRDFKNGITYCLDIQQTEERNSINADGIRAIQMNYPEVFEKYKTKRNGRITVNFKAYNNKDFEEEEDNK